MSAQNADKKNMEALLKIIGIIILIVLACIWPPILIVYGIIVALSLISE